MRNVMIKDRAGKSYEVKLLRWQDVAAVGKLGLDGVNYCLELLTRALGQDDRVEVGRRFGVMEAVRLVNVSRLAIYGGGSKDDVLP